MYLVGEITPRLSGYRPASAGQLRLEGWAGGHAFPINFSNGFGTPGSDRDRRHQHDSWYIGFNISRKFF